MFNGAITAVRTAVPVLVKNPKVWAWTGGALATILGTLAAKRWLPQGCKDRLNPVLFYTSAKDWNKARKAKKAAAASPTERPAPKTKTKNQKAE